MLEAVRLGLLLVGLALGRPRLAEQALEVDRGAASSTTASTARGAAVRAAARCGEGAISELKLRRAALASIGGFDGSLFVYPEDADLAWRARMRGWRSLYAPAAVVYHHHSATAVHASPFKYSWVGRNRVRLLARNADARMLAATPAMVAYDLAYVAYAAGRDRTLAPVSGRPRGWREWRSARRSGAAGRRRVELEPPRGLAAALARRRALYTASMPRSTRSRPDRLSYEHRRGFGHGRRGAAFALRTRAPQAGLGVSSASHSPDLLSTLPVTGSTRSRSANVKVGPSTSSSRRRVLAAKKPFNARAWAAGVSTSE